MENAETNQGNSILNALKKLERAGSEGSKTVQKLKDATYKVADFIAEQIDAVIDLDRSGGLYITGELLSWMELFDDYELHIRRFKNVEWYTKAILQKDNCCFNATSEEIEQLDDNEELRGTCRKDALFFSSDIANGLLDKIAEMLEKKNKKSITAFETIEKEIPKEN
ncbi:MAG: hypothetical protein GXX85_14145 [Ignavibacteria bacterium]|jgi:hypothetical protein|nr:hypothetical protein [Ignavibacteria bacterium]